MFKRRALTRISVVCLCLLCLAIWIIPGKPKLIRYTSPPLEFGGQTVRVSLLAPEGCSWKGGGGYSFMLPTPELGNNPYVRMTVLKRPHDTRLSWLPDWLRTKLIHPRTNDTCATVCLGDFEPSDTSVRILKSDSNRGATRRIGSEPGCVVFYVEADRSEFDATYREVCQSVTVSKPEGVRNKKRPHGPADL